MKKELNSWTPVDEKKWSNINNFSPNSQNWLDKHIPLFRLDSIMDMNPLANSLNDFIMKDANDTPFANSLKSYDPTEAMETLDTDVKKQCTNKCNKHKTHVKKTHSKCKTCKTK